MGLYEVPLSVSLLVFGWRLFSQLPCVKYYVVVKSRLNILVSNASPRGLMCLGA